MQRIKSILGKDLSAFGWGWSGHCIASCDDFNEKSIVEIGGVKVFMKPEINNNHRVSHPQIGTVISSSGTCEYKKGDKIFCFHGAFTNDDKTPIIDLEVDNKLYAKVNNNNIIGKIQEGSIIPRHGIILCSPLGYSKKSIGLIENKRRDILKVEQTYTSCEEIKSGDYILIEDNADYYFDFNGKEMIAIDLEFDDIIAVVDSINWEINEHREHKTDYSVT